MDNKHQKNQIKTYIRLGILALVVLLLAAMPLLAERKAEADGPQVSILTATAEKRDITSQIIGGGKLTSSATEEITIPAQIKLTSYLVGNGDTVKEGDPIARVDKVSVMTALQEVQETLNYLSKQLAAISSDTEPGEVKAPSDAVVKILYGKSGDDVRDVMLKHGALAVLSLDGRMAVDIPCEGNFTVGDSVKVILSDGTELTGRVESAAQGVLTASVEDNSYAVGTGAVVMDTRGTRLGAGELYIHSPWNATAYTGTITAVKAQENSKISSGRALFQLKTNGHSAEFQILTEQRREYEELMSELFALYDTGVVTAPCDGFVTGVDDDGAFVLSEAESLWRIQFMSSSSGSESGGTELPPPGEGEGGESGDGTEGSEGGEGGEGGDGTEGGEDTGCTCPDPEAGHEPDCPQYEEPAAPSSNVFQVEAVTATGVTLKYISGDNPHKPTSYNGTTYPDKTPIAVGDLVMLSADNVITKIGTAGTQVPGGNQMPQIDLSAMMGAMGGMGGFGGGAAQTFTLYPLDTLTVATVTSQEQMTLEISVDEQDISRLYTGMDATITVEAMPGQTFQATVSAIGNTGTNQGGSSKFTVKLTMDKTGDMLPGMNASAYLDLDIVSSVLTVPVAALAETGSGICLYTSYNAKKDLLSSPVAVTTGISDGEYVQILSGAAEGDTFYYAYYDTLAENLIPERGLGF